MQEFDPQENPGVARAIGEIVDRTTLLVHDEIELAKAEVRSAVQDLLRGTVAGVLGGVFAIFGLVIFLQAAALFLNDLFNWNAYPWLGYLVVAFALFLMGALSALIAMRKIKKGSQLAPESAIEEARKTQAALRPPEPVEGAVVATETQVAPPAPPARPAPPAEPIQQQPSPDPAPVQQAAPVVDKKAAKRAAKEQAKANAAAAKAQAAAEKQDAKAREQANKQAAKAQAEAEKQAAKAASDADKARKKAEKRAKKQGGGEQDPPAPPPPPPGGPAQGGG